MIFDPPGCVDFGVKGTEIFMLKKFSKHFNLSFSFCLFDAKSPPSTVMFERKRLLVDYTSKDRLVCHDLLWRILFGNLAGIPLKFLPLYYILIECIFPASTGINTYFARDGKKFFHQDYSGKYFPEGSYNSR